MIKKSTITDSLSKKPAIILPLLLLSLALVFTLNVKDVSAAPGDTIYVNGSGGNDLWNGQSATHTTGTIGPKKSIKNATDTVNKGGTINIANGVYSGAKNTNIIINTNMGIKGQSLKGTIINGTGNNWILYIATGVHATISNLTLTNGNMNAGGAIYNSGTLTVTRINLSHNSVNNGVGGAILNVGNINLTDCNFGGNTAAIGAGGAITNEGIMALTACNFINNSAKNGAGGAITNEAALNVTDSYFKGNTASYGGAIYNYGGDLTVTNSTFYRNVATNNPGGAICNVGGTFTVKQSSFTGNEAIAGGAIYSNTANPKLKDSTFTDNGKMNGSGGAIYLYSGNLTVTRCNFTSNTASQGGAIENGDKLTVKNSNFTNNIVTAIGGAIINDYMSVLNITDSTFTNNHEPYYGGGGGAIYNGGTTYIHFSRLVGNTASLANAILNDGGILDASYNWWGSNNPDFSTLIVGNSTYIPWLYLTFTTAPNKIPEGSTSTLTASFNQVSDGKTVKSINPSMGHIPDGTPVTFTTDLGNVGGKSVVKYTINGIATAILNANEGPGIANLTATADNETLNNTVTITPTANSNTTISSNTIGMQRTGLPLAPLAIAVFSILGGLTVNKKK